jgi:NAD-dependent dihydropyrimidine dehydrogenase PreA subunit
MIRYLDNVTTLELDAAKCVGCTRCTQVCPHGVLMMAGKQVDIIDRDACMECGACQKNCPTDALTVDSGVGCAIAMIVGSLRGTEPTCECRGGTCC